jgi:type VI secretion system protein ImpH
MPSKAQPKGQFNALGKNTIAGMRAWYSQGKFRLQLGPLSDTEFKQFLPGSDGLRKLKELTNHYIGPELSYDIQLISAAQHAPQCQLSKAQAPQLGYFTWLKGENGGPLQHDKLILV